MKTTNTMTTTALSPQPFLFGDATVRALLRDEAPWFVGLDVCRVLGIRNHWDALGTLEEDERDDVAIPDSMGRSQGTILISESGLYSLIFRSRKEEAITFRRWVTTEVLPNIRRHGYYGDRTRAVLSFVRDLVALGVPGKDAAALARHEFPAVVADPALAHGIGSRPILEHPADILLEIMVPGESYTIEDLINFLPEDSVIFQRRNARGARTALGSRLTYLATRGKIKITPGRHRRYSLSTIVSITANVPQ